MNLCPMCQCAPTRVFLPNIPPHNWRDTTVKAASAALELVQLPRHLCPGGERVQTGHPLTIHICAVQFIHKRETHTTRLAQGPTRLKPSRIAFHLCAPEKNLSSGVAHVSSSSVDSPAVHHEHLTFLIHSSFNHDTRTRSTTGTTRSTPRTPSTSCTSPSSPSGQAAPSRLTLA